MKQIITIALIILSANLFGQVKKDTVPPEPKLSLTLTQSQWGIVFQALRANSKMKGSEIEDMIEFLSKNFVLIDDKIKK